MAYKKTTFDANIVRNEFRTEQEKLKYDAANIRALLKDNVLPFASVNVPSGSIRSYMLDSLMANSILAGDLVGYRIMTSREVGLSSNGVIMDEDGIRGYSVELGKVFDLPADGTPPTLSGGVIEVSYLSQPQIVSGVVRSTNIYGGKISTSEIGKRVEIDMNGISLLNGSEASGNYGDGAIYGDGGIYGNGILAYVNNSASDVPFYINAEQNVADFHYYNRSADPTGAAEIGDTAVVLGVLKICTTAGTPGIWTNV